MSAQHMPIGLLGGNAPERQRRSTQQSEAQKYFQNLGEPTPLISLLGEAFPSLSSQEALTTISQFEPLTFFNINDFRRVGAFQGSTWQVIEEIDALRAGREDEAVATEYAYKNARSI